MAERNADGDADDEPTPRWVKGFGLVAIVLVLTFVILHLAGLTPDSLHSRPNGT
ncbi:MAG: hypothetical protein H0T79_16705 [Deltaproteobacteria bacterium]|nr:hypothetical protein [Deltaproteobacteria bacterium]